MNSAATVEKLVYTSFSAVAGVVNRVAITLEKQRFDCRENGVHQFYCSFSVVAYHNVMPDNSPLHIEPQAWAGVYDAVRHNALQSLKTLDRAWYPKNRQALGLVFL